MNNMGLKRLFKKGLLGGAGSLIEGHIFDALQKKKETGKPFRQCLEESVKETFTEDMPGTSHVYQMGKTDGRKQGTIEQAERDEAKMQEMHEEHEREREQWKKSDKEKDNLIDELGNKL
jgi:hypothetical protein